MDRKTKWRTFWLGMLVVLAFLSLVPTITGEAPRWFPKFLQKKVQLGLDLQGGLHIVYSINLQKAVEDKATEIKRDLESQIEDAKGDKIGAKLVLAADLEGGVNVTLTGADEAKRKQDRDRIKSFLTDYDEVVETRDCPEGVAPNTVCYRVASDYAARIKKSALEQAIRTVRDRIDRNGVAEPTVISKGEQIIVELPGLDKEAIERIKSQIARTARLEFRMVVHNHPFMKKLFSYVDDDPDAKRLGIGAKTDFWRQEDKPDPFYDYYLTAENTTKNFTVAEAKKRGCYRTDKTVIDGEVECKVTGREIIEGYLKDLAAKKSDYAVPDDFEIGYEPPRAGTTDQGPQAWRTYLLEREVQLGGSAIQKAQVIWNPTTNKPEVLVNFNRWGGKRFGDMTAAHIGHKMAIILDNQITSAPIIQGAIRGGASTITMGAANPQVAQEEAKDLVNVLRTGSLPAPLVEESHSVVGPLLGLDAIRKTQFSFILGSVLVILIMIIYYRTSGFIAIGALILNLTFMLAILAMFGATLTLPGIAALVLTVGMAVDANIIIYERIREELRLGKSVRGAVDAGFSRGFAAILDGNLTTAAAGYVLMQYGSGPIRGFAVMLIIGIASTLFTATWCTRLFFEYYVGRGRKTTTIAI